MAQLKEISLTGSGLRFSEFESIVYQKAPVYLERKTIDRLLKSRKVVEEAIRSGKSIYSINTGFGVLSKVTIDSRDLEELQSNLIRSHCCGVDEIHTEQESRAIMLLRANALAKGYSGVRPELVGLLVGMLNESVHPVIPSRGSVGASGDLAPLAHLASVLIGEGEAFFQGKRMPGGQALKKAGLSPLVLAPKEGLALINGTQQMTACASISLIEAQRLVDQADLICACSLEGVLGTPAAFADWVQRSRPHGGQIETAEKLRQYLKDSEIRESHQDCDRVQDPYSFRCVPQVHGAVRDLLRSVQGTLVTEMNSATDNPLVNPDTGEILSNGNFHGQPVAFALDILGMAIAELGSVSERRLAKLIDPEFSDLPCFLIHKSGLNSGFMMTQVTSASLVSENRLLTHPASTDSIPTNNEKEDHVSMGPIGARKLQRILRNTQYILGTELFAACQALDFRRPLKPGLGPRRAYALVRKNVPYIEKDEYLHPHMEKVTDLIRSGSLYRQLREGDR